MKKIYSLLFFLAIAGTALQAQQIRDNFEDIRKGTYGFISGTFIPYNGNPDQSGANTSLVAAAYTRNPAEAFDVIILDGLMADLSDYVSGAKAMTIDVWSPAVGKTVQITVENSTLALPANFPTGRHSVYLATTTVANQWETLTFNFDNQPDPSVSSTSVDRIVLLFDPNTNNNDTYYWDNLVVPELADDPCDGVAPDDMVLQDFECNQSTYFTFSHAGVNFRRVVNPDPNGMNTSDYVGSYIRNGGEENDVIVGRLASPLAIGTANNYSLQVWDENPPTNVVLSLQKDGVPVQDITATTSATNSWETIIFAGGGTTAEEINEVVILFDPGNFSSGQYFFDNLELTGTIAVEELPGVAAFQVFPNPSAGLTNFEFELERSAEVQLSIYDLNGRQIGQILNGSLSAGQHQASWDAAQAADGLYYYTLTVDGALSTGKIALQR